MNKDLYLHQLRMQLYGLPKEDIERILSEYELFFRDALSSGMTEEETIIQLGSPENIARDVKETQGIRHYEPNHKPIGANIFIVIVLLCFNFFFLFGPVIGISAVLIAFIVTSGAFIAVPFIAIFLFMNDTIYAFELFGAIVLGGIGILFNQMFVKLFRLFVNLLKSYIAWNVCVMRGEN